MRLIDLLEGLPEPVIPNADAAGTTIAGLTCDSRQVRPGFLFAALPGSRVDGRAYIADAVGHGAAAVLAPPGTDAPAAGGGAAREAVPLITDENPRRRFALMAARFYGRQPDTVAAVTGTNGKTSVVYFLRQIWTHLGQSAASLGTLGVAAPGIDRPGSLTAPDPVALHAVLAELADAGVTRLAMEASSHGLDQFRLDGVRIAAGAFTNLTRDHLDYHGFLQSYRAAKARLFSDLVTDDGVAVINADSDASGEMAAVAYARGLDVLTYGASGSDVRVDRLQPTAEGQRISVTVGDLGADLTLPLVGGFQASNALCAAALAIATGEAVEDALAALETLQSVPGRVERAATRANGAAVYVDYAHTPDALAAVLKALRPHGSGRLGVVFGCGGDRDAGKRPEMGRIAANLADAVIVTDDNPRTENAATIRRDILAACPDATEIADRAEAIAAAVRGLGSGDVLVVAGKGHEQGQIVGTEVRPFDDAEQVRAAVRESDA